MSLAMAQPDMKHTLPHHVILLSRAWCVSHPLHKGGGEVRLSNRVRPMYLDVGYWIEVERLDTLAEPRNSALNGPGRGAA